jgi:GH15 family glucan-1,4-alpha-glucosidase
VSRDGSIDWLCLPRFDSDACFAALLGDERHGRWLLAPRGAYQTHRAYDGDTLVLRSDHRTDDGAVRVTDFMTPRRSQARVVRAVEGLSGAVPMRSELELRFDYGGATPWLRPGPARVTAVAGPDAVDVVADVPLDVTTGTVAADFTVRPGDRVAFVLTWHRSYEPAPPRIQPWAALRATIRYWERWVQRCTYRGEWRAAVLRSLVTLKALTYAPTGGVVAAATTSLPERIGGVRNWDYRLCWLRDATLVLTALVDAGYGEEAAAWRDWLLRAVAGDPGEMQIMYGLAGERRLDERELPWLAGYEGSRPVRVGNAAHLQLQLDVYGEVMDCLFQAEKAGLAPVAEGWRLQRALLDFLEGSWDAPDEGIWEIRAERQHFTHSKVMAWVAFDRAIGAVQRFGLEGPVDRWRALRHEIHEDVCRRGFDADRGAFVQRYGAKDLDASLLMIPAVGFLPPRDPRVLGTIDAIGRELVDADCGLVRRYDSATTPDGLPPGEGVFLACSFWLVDALALAGRRDEAVRLFERVRSLVNDVGLLSEQYDPRARRMLGNFPQAFSHMALVGSAEVLAHAGGPAGRRSR